MVEGIVPVNSLLFNDLNRIINHLFSQSSSEDTAFLFRNFFFCTYKYFKLDKFPMVEGIVPANSL